MRIPTSLIVMSLLTAVPFGLAIRDTVTGKQSRLADDDELDVRQEREWLERHERMLAAEAEARELKRAQLHAKLDQLYGARARMGSLLDGIALGPVSSPLAIETMSRYAQRISTRDSLHVEIEHTHTDVTDVIVDVGDDDDACEALGSKLTAAWGSSTAGAWLDPESHTRAHFDRDLCRLTFQRYADPADWILGVPFETVGQPVAKLLAVVPNAIVEDQLVWWVQPGVGYGTRRTEVSAVLNSGRIASIRASSDTDYDSLVAIRDLVSKKLAAKPARDVPEGWSWTSRTLEASLVEDSGGFILYIGRP